MDRKTYFKNKKVIDLYSITITCLIVGILLHYGKITVVSNKVSSVIAITLIFIGYLLFIKIANRLKDKNIHGLTNIVWSTYFLFMHGAYRDFLQKLPIAIILFISMVVMIYFLIDGIIRFTISLVDVFKESSRSDEKTIESVDTVVAILTSLLAIIISIIEIL